jgi:N-dimethylarginine dimethylaminohydrolase
VAQAQHKELVAAYEHFGVTVPIPGHDDVAAERRVIAPKASRTLIQQLRARGFEVAEIDTSEISKTGGGVHCMAQALRRVPS